MQMIVSLLVSAFAVIISAYILPGVHVADFFTAVVVAIALGVINMFVKPVLVILTLPITVVTLGLFLLVLNAIIILAVGSFVPGFRVDGFWWALAFSIILSFVGAFLHSLAKE